MSILKLNFIYIENKARNGIYMLPWFFCDFKAFQPYKKVWQAGYGKVHLLVAQNLLHTQQFSQNSHIKQP